MSGETFWIRFVIGALATWRVTHLLAKEDGPADLIVRVRALLGHGLAGKLMDCFYCLSMWIAAPVALFVADSTLERMLVWLALSGAACLAERTGSEPLVIRRARPEVEREIENGLLWSEETGLEAERGFSRGGGGARAESVGSR